MYVLTYIISPSLMGNPRTGLHDHHPHFADEETEALPSATDVTTLSSE